MFRVQRVDLDTRLRQEQGDEDRVARAAGDVKGRVVARRCAGHVWRIDVKSRIGGKQFLRLFCTPAASKFTQFGLQG